MFHAHGLLKEKEDSYDYDDIKTIWIWNDLHKRISEQVFFFSLKIILIILLLACM